MSDLLNLTAKEMDAMLANIKRSQQPAIRNYKKTSHVNLPPVDVSTLRLSTQSDSILTSSTDIKYGAKPKQPQRPLTAAECNELFGIEQAIKMNFIPQMITSVVMQQASLLVNYCRDNRVSITKKHMRLIKSAVEEYTENLRSAYGPGYFRAYAEYVKRYHSEIESDMWMMETHAESLCSNQMPHEIYRAIPIRVMIITLLIRFSQNYDRKMDNLIASKIGQPVHQTPDVYQQTILAMCISLAEDLVCKIIPDKTMEEWMKVLSNKANILADKIIKEELVN